MLPLRALVEAIGGTVQWDGENNIAMVTSLIAPPPLTDNDIDTTDIHPIETLQALENRFPRMAGLNNTAPPIEGGNLVVAYATDLTPPGIFNSVFTSLSVDSDIFSWFGGGSIFSITPARQIGQHGIATWQADHEERSITIIQVEDVYWHDGTPLTLGDLVFAKEIIAAPGYSEAGGTRWGTAQQNIVGAWEFHHGEADHISGLVLSEDKRELTIYFIDFTPSLLYFGFWTSPYPRHIFADIPIEEQPTHYYSLIRPIGWGPFIVEEIPGEGMVFLSANDNFWLGRPYLDEVVIVTETWDDIPFMIYEGWVDIARFPAWVYPLHDPGDFQLLGSVPNAFNYVAFNMGYWDAEHSKIVPRENPRMGDINLRRAMAYAIDNAWIGAIGFNGLRLSATSIIPPGHSQFLDTELEGFPYNPDKAMALLDEAGFTVGPNGWRTFPDGSELVIHFVVADSDFFFGNHYSQAWMDISLNVHIEWAEWNDKAHNIFHNDNWGWDVITAGWVVGANPDPNVLWGHSVNNRPRFINDTFEAHLAGFNAPQAWDLDWLTNHYHEWQRLFYYYAPAFPTNWRVDLTAVNNRVINYYVGIAEDGIRTKGGFHHIQVTE